MSNDNKIKQIIKKLNSKIFNKSLNDSSSPIKEENIKYIDEIKVALISDQFTHDSFKYEFKIIEISPDDWLKKFECENPDLFFCESAWHGYYNGENGAWYGKIEKTKEGPENREILFEILNYCKKNNIPTIFWNKEDPVYYNKEGEFFTDTAIKFDYIFTSAEEVVDEYKKDYNHENVHTLMFAGQPILFNPLNKSKEKVSEVIFAGSYYKDHEERAKIMDMIFDKIIEQNIALKIYDRTYYQDIPHIGYPEKYKKYTLPPIDYKDTSEIYKKSKWAININTITQSNTMFARRVFELALSNTNIISNYSKGMKNIFKNNVHIIEENDFPDLNKNYENERLENIYAVLKNHTYYERWKYILDTINFPYKERVNDVEIIFKVEDSENIPDIENKFNKITYSQKKLVLITDDLSKKYKTYRDIESALADIKSEFYIIANASLDNDFIEKAILHYKYLDKNYGVKSGENKFTLDTAAENENILFNKKINILNKKYNEIYYI